jgi:capsid protein
LGLGRRHTPSRCDHRAGWRLSSKPNARSLGIDPDAASDLASDIEAAWRDFAEDPDCWCDAGRRMTMGGLLALAFRHRLMDGEALAAILWLPRGGRYATAIQVIDPDRLSNPYNAIDTYWRRQGIELGEQGRAPLRMASCLQGTSTPSRRLVLH